MRVLVIEDEPNLAQTIAQALTEAGYATDVALDGESGIELGLETGVDIVVLDLLLPKLLALVRALSRRVYRVLPESRVSAGDLEVDLAAHLVTQDGRMLKLSTREYRILVHFIANSGRVSTCSEIGEHVIDMVFEPASNVVDVSISGLRMKLGEPTLIHTVRGVGYRFDAHPPGTTR